MRLTAVLSLIKLPKGHIFRGKYRLVKQVTAKDVASLRNDFKREELNMFYLRHPYLTLEQDRSHNAYLRTCRKRIPKEIIERNEKFSKHRTLDSELSHLKVGENWEFGGGSQSS